MVCSIPVSLMVRHTTKLFVLLRFFFFFNDTATTEIYTLSLHDALPIWCHHPKGSTPPASGLFESSFTRSEEHTSELQSRFGISYAVFCLKKKKHKIQPHTEHLRLRLFTTHLHVYTVHLCLSQH